jgi:hypothetical protein
MLLRSAFEPLIFVELSPRRVKFCSTSRPPVDGDLTVFTVPRVDANKIKNIPLQKPMAVLPLQG